MVDRKGKRTFISISSDSESESAEEQEDSDEEEITSSSSSSDDDGSEWSADEVEEDVGDEEESEEVEDEDGYGDSGPKKSPLGDQALYNRIIYLIKSGDDLQSLKLEECKVYLRKHELRLTGTKAVCIQRMQEHWRIKDGAEKLYPRSSFTINCTGDVCKGDVVLFKQRVYERFHKVTRTGNVIGKRTIAGMVVKESYGAAKQQHTFTVEVLWSKGVKKLPPLFPLLVKGRNLYRMRTFRQCWDNEAERVKVLGEKHRRGTAARHLRAMKKASIANRAAKRQKHSDHTRPPPKRQRKEEPQPATREERKRDPGHGKAPRGKEKMNRGAKSRTTKSSARDMRSTHHRENEVPLPHPRTLHGPPGKYYGQKTQLHVRQVSPMIHGNRETFSFPNHQMGSTSTVTRMSPYRPYSTVRTNPLHHAYVNTGSEFDPRSLNHFPDRSSNDRRMNSLPCGAGMYTGYLSCSTPGCRDQGDDKCFGLSCWRCCRRSGRSCHRHQLHHPF